ncbi:unnamed protein product [Acanthoscelides obtectus]|uniref:RNA helicase n=1 Tax=Acanthoscelides obtectus TaxID=200917 RepID=A0A9P0KAC0_ACAOB|nr:unnamed protein product [Acanthoscelides obtectus]CAK1652045.1 Putative ATP-dependent RNA helicase TDRD12 [Acanthoscelides obtectus]
MVNGPQTGKTMAYLTTMCSFLVEKDERYSFTKKLSGAPIIVILCSNTKRYRDVNDRAWFIMGRNKARIALVEYPVSNVNTTHIDMLITIPTIFVDLLKKRSITLNGLCHLVFEDGDNILNHYYPLIDMILEKTHKMLKNRHHSKSLQLILCAEHWTKKITCVLQKLAAIPVVCIANYLEAAMYGKIQFSMRFMRSSAKLEMMKRLLKDTYKFTKSVIICNNAELDVLEATLIMSGIDVAVISEKLTVDESHLIEENWTKAPVENYTELNVTSATMLIHYSLPSSWTKFTIRFTCLLESYRSPLDQRESKITTQSIVLLDENCQEELPKFFKYIKTTDLKHYLCDALKQYTEMLIFI